MTKGFLIFAQNNNTTDYIRQAEFLKSSIEKHCKVNNVKIVSEFDNDLAKDSTWKIENRWKSYELSPYDETIVLDADMLCTSNIDYLWNCNEDVSFTTQVLTYRNQLVTSNYYRKTFVSNNLPNIYSALYYFKKTQAAKEFFNLFELICNNWEIFYKEFAPINQQKWASIDVSAAIASKILNLKNDNNFKFVHMKPYVQYWQEVPDKWISVLPVSYKDELFIGNFKQRGLFHYVEDEFLDVLRLL